jgi:hypothetical protein
MTTARLRNLAAVLLLLAVLGLTACSGGGGDADESAAGGGVAADEAAPAEDRADGDAGARNATLVADEELAPTPKAVIATGMVSLTGADAGQVRFDVGKVVDAHDGEVAEEETETDDKGNVTRSRLVVRVPVADFDAAMDELEKVARLASSTRNADDVTTEVIDTDVRIRAQSESLKRVEVLLAQAQSIRDIVAIEAQLTRRQAELDSLKARQAYLADQTSMSTITVYVERQTAAERKAEEDDTGFLAGLGDGWDGMTTFLVGLATVTGLLLPFAVLLLVLGLPTWIVVRGQLRRRAATSVGQTG